MPNIVLPTPPRSRQLRASHLATHAVFHSGVAPTQVEELAVGYIRSVLAGDADEPRPAPPPILPPPPKLTPSLVWDGLQTDLRRVALDTLLAPLTVPRPYRPRGSLERWVTRLLLGGRTIAEPEQLQKDLGLDLARHAANLHALRGSCPQGWRLLVRAELLALYRVAGTTPELAGLIRAVVHDQIILTGVVRARMLAEYLRRLATEPMGPRFDVDDPLWAKRGALFVDRLARPARSIDRLLSMPGRSSVRETLGQAVASGGLAYDPRLLPMARRIYQQVGATERAASTIATASRAMRAALAPLTAITPAMLRDDGLGRESFADARLGLSVPEAVAVLAINLVALDRQANEALAALDAGHVPLAYPRVPPLPAGVGGKVRRTANALKAISGCDRHVGDTSTDPDNKAGRILLRRVKRRLTAPMPPHGLALLRLLPPEWSL
ncbi:hypothetical protein [Sphingomonas sp. 1P08PE]|uniref:hypothetical protein n=1 Tax=Sphingomonas sp. 1P08PE TaxID=554122 RepID=UPI0039A3E3BA